MSKCDQCLNNDICKYMIRFREVEEKFNEDKQNGKIQELDCAYVECLYRRPDIASFMGSYPVGKCNCSNNI